MRILCISIVALLATASTASAGEGGGCSKDANFVVQHMFDAADSDRDGNLTREEYEGAGLQQFGVGFEASDLDGDGTTTLDEYLDLYDRHHPPVDGTEA